MEQKNTYQANELLELIITVHLLTANIQHARDEDIWFFERYHSDLPIYYRLRQIEALTKAFGIYKAPTSDKSHFSRLLAGSFLGDTPYIQSYPALLEVAKDFHEVNQYPIDEELSFLRMRYIYPLLLNDLLKMHYAIYSVGQGIAVFPERLFRQHILCKIDFQPVHQLICHILDPQKRSFSKSDLIQQFDFPDVDMNEVEEAHRRNQPNIDFDDY